MMPPAYLYDPESYLDTAVNYSRLTAATKACGISSTEAGRYKATNQRALMISRKPHRMRRLPEESGEIALREQLEMAITAPNELVGRA
ncbi:hypothetical protein AS038_16160 [Arthrobacter sp. NIO-1057]|nr:hypothetical protein AS038_16160 [Arthrobacter sp. NIO-1057]